MRWGLGAVVWAACYNPLEFSPTPTVVATSYGSATNQLSLEYPVVIPLSSGLILLVTVQLGASDCNSSEPQTAGVMYGSATLQLLAVLHGTSPACGSSSTSSELWQVVAPSAGEQANVMVTLGGSGGAAENSFQSGAVAIASASTITAGDSQLVGSASGSATTFEVTVASHPNDLVVSFVGHGQTISGPDPDTAVTQLYLHDGDGNTTLNNIAASSMTADSEASTMGWDGANDDWESFVVAIRPAPP